MGHPIRENTLYVPVHTQHPIVRSTCMYRYVVPGQEPLLPYNQFGALGTGVQIAVWGPCEGRTRSPYG